MEWPTLNELFISICETWLTPFAPPVIPAGFTTICPTSSPTLGKQFGEVIVTKFVKKLAS